MPPSVGFNCDNDNVDVLEIVQTSAGGRVPSAIRTRHGLVSRKGSFETGRQKLAVPQSACHAQDLCMAVSLGTYSSSANSDS